MNLPQYSLSEITKALQIPDTKLFEIEQKYHSASITSEEKLFDFILSIGIAEEKTSLAEGIVFDLEERINIVKHKLKFIKDDVKPKVLCLTSIHPLSIETNPYLAEIIQISGGKPYNLGQEEGGVLNPGILLIISDQMERLFGDLAVLLSLDEWKSTDAVKNNAVFLLDGSKHFSGFGLQVADDIEILAEIFYPQQLTFGGNGETWVQFET